MVWVRARSRFYTGRSAASDQHDCAVHDSLFLNGVLRRYVFKKRSDESAELLPNFAGAGEGDRPVASHAALQLNR
jgi:hypothetical protein